MIGEIGGSAEEEAAAWIKAYFKKPVVGFIAGQTAPPGAGWATRARSSPAARARRPRRWPALTAAGVHVVKSPADIGRDGLRVKRRRARTARDVRAIYSLALLWPDLRDSCYSLTRRKRLTNVTD